MISGGRWAAMQMMVMVWSIIMGAIIIQIIDVQKGIFDETKIHHPQGHRE